MSALKIALLGLDRTTASIGLALRRYMTKGGRYQFTIVGYDRSPDVEKKAQKLGAVDHTERSITAAVADCDLVVLALSYEDVEQAYRNLANTMREGAVVLDASPIKGPSLEWAAKYLGEEQHMIGITPIVNPRYLYQVKNDVESAEEDTFDDSTTLLTPSASSLREAVDLAFNFAQILGSKPRFLDPHEHDTLLVQTEQLPALLGTVFFSHLSQQGNWDDLQWFTNATFGALTRTLFDTHPDALRDEWMQNRDVLVRVLDQYMQMLTQYRDALNEGDFPAIEAAIVKAAEDYETWINRRYRADWDSAGKPAEPAKGGSIMQGLLGGAISDRLFGKDKKED